MMRRHSCRTFCYQLFILCINSMTVGLPISAAANAIVARAQAVPNPAVLPADRTGEGWWADRHKAVLASVKSHPDAPLLLIGDSITNNYDKSAPPDENFQPIWKQFYESRGALNLGFSGDTTANVLWRLDHGEVEGLSPKVAVLLIGTNNTNTAGNTAEQTEVGTDAVVADLELRLPKAHIILLGILPSGLAADVVAKNLLVNRYLAACYGENPRVTYLDIGSVFYSEGTLNEAIFYDPRLPQHGRALHPDTVGQRKMAEAIEPTLAKWMGDKPPIPLTSMTDINTALIPVDRLEPDSYDWSARHHAELAEQPQLAPQVVLIGDSITHFWDGPPSAQRVSGPHAWQHVFGDMRVLNMGFGWDRTQNVLWRLRQGEFTDLHPKWVVLAIGTNNLAASGNARANTPAEVAEGVFAIYATVHRESPASHIIVMAIFPRGAKATGRFRAPILETNRLLAARFSKDPAVIYLDIGSRFLAPDGTLPAALMPDGTHPSEAGYGIWADALIQAGIRP